jgi:hypothetical protein
MMEGTRRVCPDCGGEEWIGVEYPYDDPLRYDGISEWRCTRCGCRIGRWTGRRLTGSEGEPRYGMARGYGKAR